MFNLEPKSLLSPCASIHFRVHVLRVTGHAHHLFVVYNCAVVNHWILKLISMLQMQLDYVCYIYTTIIHLKNINNLYKQLTIHYRESPSLQCNGNKARPGQTSRMRWLNNSGSQYARCSASPTPEPNCAHGRSPAVRLWNIYPRPRRVLGAVGLGWQLKLEMRIGDDVAPKLSLKIKIEYAEIKKY